jgi:hypothetical protein
VNTLYSSVPPLFRPGKPRDVLPSDSVGEVQSAAFAYPWPDDVPGLGPRRVGPFEVCNCGRWSWVRYGARVVCLDCVRRHRRAQ